MSRPSTPVFGVVGWKNSGKTTLMERLVSEFTERGFTVSTVKHAHHRFDVDHPGTDSFRHRVAGAREVALVSSRRLAIMRELGDREEPPLSDILAALSPADLVLVEGYKPADHPKIEIRAPNRPDRDGDMTDLFPGIVALAIDAPGEDSSLPQFHRDNVADIADFIAHHLGISAKRTDGR